MCVQCPCPDESVMSPGTGVRNNCKLPHGCLESNLSPLEKQPVFFTVEPSLQPHLDMSLKLIFLICKVWLKIPYNSRIEGKHRAQSGSTAQLGRQQLLMSLGFLQSSLFPGTAHPVGSRWSKGRERRRAPSTKAPHHPSFLATGVSSSALLPPPCCDGPRLESFC